MHDRRGEARRELPHWLMAAQFEVPRRRQEAVPRNLEAEFAELTERVAAAWNEDAAHGKQRVTE